MPKSLTLRQYVRHRNGVPLGHRDSMRNMLARAFGAGTLAGFWRHWNPIWSYGLGRFVNAPLSLVLPSWLAMLATFAVSGLIHDAVIMALRGEPVLLFTPWFTLVACGAVAGSHLGWNFAHLPFAGRAAIHAIWLAAALLAAFALFEASGFGWLFG